MQQSCVHVYIKLTCLNCNQRHWVPPIWALLLGRVIREQRSLVQYLFTALSCLKVHRFWRACTSNLFLKKSEGTFLLNTTNRKWSFTMSEIIIGGNKRELPYKNKLNMGNPVALSRVEKQEGKFPKGKVLK